MGSSGDGRNQGDAKIEETTVRGYVVDDVGGGNLGTTLGPSEVRYSRNAVGRCSVGDGSASP